MKDVIQRTIMKGYHNTDNEKIKNQKWEDFFKICSDKKLFVYGMGEAANCFFERKSKLEKVEIEAFLDKNHIKQGEKISNMYSNLSETKYKDYVISDPEILKNYNSDDVAVLITVTQNYENIICFLESYGIYNNYVMLIMEANSLSDEDESYSGDESEDDYLEYCCGLEINPRKIVFRNMGTYSGHGKYITEKLLEINKDLDIVWLVNYMNISVPDGVRLVYMNNLKKVIYEMETAHIWVFDYLIHLPARKRPEQIYIQVKHWSSITLKSFGLLLDEYRGGYEKNDIIREGSQMDYLIAGSDFDVETCKKYFAFKGTALKFGSARSDILFSGDIYSEKIRKMYNIKGKKIALYAPTFRNDLEKSYVAINNIELDFLNLKKQLDISMGGEWCILLRLHPSVASENVTIEKNEFVINVSDYPESQELVAVSDIMITDYSSIMFEPAFVRKPVFLFAPDRSEYINKERELLIDYDTLPFPIAETNEELSEIIRNFDNDSYVKNVDAFMEKYGVNEDGHASERTAQFILGLL